jgi:methylated-DNA-protein-cysteine methyltransferase related protein
MAKSPFFARIKQDVLKIVAVIPEGSVATYHEIGEHLDVVPRHVAYILSTLEIAEKEKYPWFRVVGESGKLGARKTGENGESQAELLEHEGIAVEGNRICGELAKLQVTVGKLKSGVPKQVRPPDAPKSSKPRLRN